jgi:hypothetical protein
VLDGLIKNGGGMLEPAPGRQRTAARLSQARRHPLGELTPGRPSQTCQALGIEPWRYLRDLLERLASHRPQRLADLLPEDWARAQRQAASAALPSEAAPASSG